VVGAFETARPTPLSVMREIVADSHGFANALLEVQRRKIKTTRLDTRARRQSHLIANLNLTTRLRLQAKRVVASALMNNTR
jgi:hypothetical protein